VAGADGVQYGVQYGHSLMCILGEPHVGGLCWWRAVCSMCPWPPLRRFVIARVCAEERANTTKVLSLLSRGTFWHSECDLHVHSNSLLLHVCWDLQINKVVQLVVQYIKVLKIVIDQS